MSSLAGSSGSTSAVVSTQKSATRSIPAWLPTLVQLALAAAIVYLYQIESATFFRLFVLATVGFAVHAVLPLAYRLPFFVVLSLGGVFVVFSPTDAAWLIGSGAVLLALANLPLAVPARAAVLLGVAVALGASRAGLVTAPWSAGVWPILGSMFMFRLVLYLMASGADSTDRRSWWSLAYFFMFPNLVFPLYPVVDYQTFRRTYYDKDDSIIYDQGMLWVARGLVHLLLYRFIYHNVITDAESVVTLGDLVQFMLATLLLYLRVSGQFHLIVGLLHLFGFRLPETHKLYLLSHNFVELWRRINIYWTDFMMKTVFYPTYFKVKQRGPKAALVISTVVVFVTTWLLHSYQWFWLRGGFPLTPQDLVFWTILGGFVVFGGLKELNAVRKPRRLGGQKGWNPRLGLRTGVTFIIFFTLWSLWSTESLGTWLWMLGSAANVDVKGVVLLAASFTLVALLGGRDWTARGGERAAWLEALHRPSSRALAWLLILLAMAQPVTQAAMPEGMAVALRALQTTGLNARDLTLQHRGYYEQLEVREQLDTPVSADGRKRDASWQTLDQLGLLNERRDLMLRDLKPLQRTTWNGKAFSTNQWGMRDEDYAEAKPSDTLRIAILGPSHVMGNNVADDEVFERLVERRLNADTPGVAWRHVEILNFGVDGYSLPQQVALLEDRVFRFSPDVVIATHYKDNRDMTEGFLLKVAEQRIEVRDAELAALIAGAGLLDTGRGVPLPFAWARHLASLAGLEARMPHGEARSRARRVSDDVLATSFRRFATLTRARGAVPVVLALNVVLDNVPGEVPLRSAIQATGMPLFDLFKVYPVEGRDALRVAPWDDHPNGAGHQVIADRLYRDLTHFLSSGALARAGSLKTVD